MTETEHLDDYRWLISAEGAAWLEKTASASSDIFVTTKTLRSKLTANRTHLVLEQVELRRRALAKFPSAPKLFFTRTALEQATEASIAWHKAERFRGAKTIADICCGIGGDLMALAEIADVTGFDRDPVVALLAEANVQANSGRSIAVRSIDARDIDIAEFSAWHLDPDRRSEGHRTTRLESYEPPLDWIETALQANPRGAIKLAPATQVSETWERTAERQWIGSRRECRQQIAWFGDLALHPGCRTATVVGRLGEPSRTVVGNDRDEIEFVAEVQRYLYEPHAAILAARVTASLAAEHQLYAFCDDTGYLTSDQHIEDAAIAGFEIVAAKPLDIRTLRELMLHQNIGRLEIKKRGIDIDPEKLRRELRLRGELEATLILAPTKPKPTAFLAHRISAS